MFVILLGRERDKNLAKADVGKIMKKLTHCCYLIRENHDRRYAKWIKSVVILSHKIKTTWALGYSLLTE